jgi:drug/metabolite transporter (DMT)-like permease
MRQTQVSLVGTLVGAGFWGLSGTAAQALFQTYQFPVIGLVAIRTLVSGLILFVIVRPTLPQRPLGSLLALSILGFAGSQLAYLGAIQFSNAATATLLQFLFLPMVAVYEAVKGVLRWSVRWTASILFAMIGTLFLVGGVPGWNLRVLVTPVGVLFGLLAAISGAYYTIASRSLVRVHGTWWVTTWGFVIGGLATLPFGVLSLFSYQMPSTSYGLGGLLGLVVFVIVFGTILAYGLYLAGLRRLSATEIGLASSSEPIVASVAAFVFLGVVLTAVQYLGGAMIVTAVILLATRKFHQELISVDEKTT